MKNNLIKATIACLIMTAIGGNGLYAQKRYNGQRVIVIMMDGFGEKYYRQASMPFLNQMEKAGIYKVVPSLMPAVTNVNNMAIATGTTAEQNGITGNVYYDAKRQKEVYIEDPSILLTPSIFQKAHARGVKTALLSVKKKTIDVMGKYADYALCPECLPAQIKWKDKPVRFSDVYSRQVSYQVLDAANTLLKIDKSVKLLYIHTTDYPMHMWAPESDSVKVFLANVDRYIAMLHKTAPDAAILITADHDLNHKSQAWDLEKVLTEQHTPVKIVISPEKDRYMVHHRGLGGAAYVYLQKSSDAQKVRQNLLKIKGVDAVLTKAEAVKKYHLMSDRIGDFMVMADKETVFGYLEKGSYEKLPDTYRSHGSTYETQVPLFVYNARNAPQASYFNFNYKLAAWLF
jgi:phosphonoacetate hydrolase